MNLQQRMNAIVTTRGDRVVDVNSRQRAERGLNALDILRRTGWYGVGASNEELLALVLADLNYTHGAADGLNVVAIGRVARDSSMPWIGGEA